MAEWVGNKTAQRMFRLTDKAVAVLGARGVVRRRLDREQRGKKRAFVYSVADLAAWVRVNRPEIAADMRPCLRCDQEFASEGSHNRVCPPCQSVNARHSQGGNWDYCVEGW